MTALDVIALVAVSFGAVAFGAWQFYQLDRALRDHDATVTQPEYDRWRFL